MLKSLSLFLENPSPQSDRVGAKLGWCLRIHCQRRWRGTKVGSCVPHTQSTEHAQHGVEPSFGTTEVPIVLPMFPFGRAVRSS